MQLLHLSMMNKQKKGHLLFASSTNIDWYGSDPPPSYEIFEYATEPDAIFRKNVHDNYVILFSKRHRKY